MILNISNSIKVDSIWQKVELKTTNNVYLIVAKNKPNKKDTINCENVKKVRFEIAIDSGIKDKPLTIRYFNIDFDDITSGNNEINRTTGFVKLVDIPNKFYIRVSSLDDGFKSIKNGTTNITVNINEID